MARSVPSILPTLVLAAALLAAGPAQGLSSDRAQPIKINADRVAVDQKKGVNTYSGNVRLVQGSLRITAEQIVVSYRGSQVEKVSASGKPLTLRQRPNAEAPEIVASAHRLHYYALENRLDLFDEVSLRRGEDMIRSKVLHYDLQSNVLSATGKDDEERVYTVLKPKKNEPTARDRSGDEQPAGR